MKLHFQVRDRDGAIRLLEELIDMDPAAPGHHAMLRDAKSRVVAYLDDAERHFREAIRLEPKNATIHFEMALYYERAGKPAKAHAALKTALRLDPKFREARRRLSRASGAKKSMGTVITSLFR